MVHERPYGMQDYFRWYNPKEVPKFVAPADFDGVLQSNKWDQALMFEFKPAHAEITVGQKLTMEWFSKREGITGILIKDPFYSENSGETMDLDTKVEVTLYVNGKGYTLALVTLQDINDAISNWWNKGEFKSFLKERSLV